MKLRRPLIRTVTAGRLTALAAGCFAVALLVSTSIAQARAPVLLSVGAEGPHATAVWTKESGMKMRFIEIATDAETNENGYFRGTNIFSFSVLSSEQLTFTDKCGGCLMQPGTKYYVHVASEDRTYFGKCPGREFSNTMSVVLNEDGTTTAENLGGGDRPCPAAAPPVSGDVPPGQIGPGPDRLPPFLSLVASRRQDIDKLRVTVRPNEQVTVTAAASVKTPGGAAKLYRFKQVTRNIAARQKTRLRLKLAPRSLRAVKRALRRGKRLRAKITLRSKDRAGNSRIDHVRVLLRP